MGQLAQAGLDLQAGMSATYDASTTITLPMTFGLGAALPATDRLRLSGEVEWRNWSDAERTMPFRLTNGENTNINFMVNANPANGDFTYTPPLNASGFATFDYTIADPSGATDTSRPNCPNLNFSTWARPGVVITPASTTSADPEARP